MLDDHMIFCAFSWQQENPAQNLSADPINFWSSK